MKPLVRMTMISGLFSAILSNLAAAPDNAAMPREIACFPRHRIVNDLAFSPDGKILAVADFSKKGVQLYDVASKNLVVVLPHPAGHALFSPDGKIVATAGRDIKIWETASGKNITTFKGIIARWLLFSPDGKRLAVIGKDEITVFDLDKKEQLHTRDISPAPFEVFAYPTQEKPVYFLKPGKSEHIALLDAFTGAKVATCRNRMERTGHFGHFVGDREEKILAGACLANRFRAQIEVHLWDRRTGKEIDVIWLGNVLSLSFALNPDGNILAIDSRGFPPFSEPSGLRFYEVPGCSLLATQEVVDINSGADGHGTHTLVFSPDGQLFATACGGTVKLWSIPDAWRKKK